MMEQNEILSRVDHTLLTPTATWEQVRALCDEGKQFGVASVCIPPRYVKRANDYAGGLKICTVIGFPNGYATPEVKVFETMLLLLLLLLFCHLDSRSQGLRISIKKASIRFIWKPVECFHNE